MLAAADAKAAYYKMVACSHTNGAPPFSVDTNTRSSANPNGIFHIWNWCDGQGGDPPGDGAFFRIQEHQDMPHTAGENAYGNFIFDRPAWMHGPTAPLPMPPPSSAWSSHRPRVPVQRRPMLTSSRSSSCAACAPVAATSAAT